MATSETHSKKQMKRLESGKSHSWWWDSHINPKNSKWLAENLEGMDKSVKRMLKLIEEDGDSFAKKAEMYYQKRPELISLVEDFYRMYRSLAERYDHVTGELRKNVPSDLQSQCSCISDIGSTSGQSSTLPSPPRHGHRKSSNRAAGFDFFLGSGGNVSDVGHGEGYESSTLTESEEESDDSSINNDSGLPASINVSDNNGHNRKIMELEIELRELKEKLWLQEEENAERGARNENAEDIHAKVNRYEQELKIVREKLRLSEEEISFLKIELDRLRSLESANLQAAVEFSSTEENMKRGGAPVLDLKTSELQRSVDKLEQEPREPDNKIKSLKEELRITKEKLEASEKHIALLEFEATKSSKRIQRLQDQLDSASKDIAAWKTKFNREKRETTKLLERLENINISLSDQDHEIIDLKAAVADAEQKIFPEKAQVKAEMSKLMVKRTHLEEQIREWECRGRSLEEEIRKINSEKAGMEAHKGEIEQLKADIKERESNIEDLNVSFKALKIERDNLNAEVGWLKGEVNRRDDQIEQLGWHLNQLHMEQAKLNAGMGEAHKQVEEFKLRAKELEEEVERQRSEILEGAEEKREAIRQLCLSIEHYRNDYNRLRQDYIGRKGVSVLAA